jgi:di/tricarboxylate transporter
MAALTTGAIVVFALVGVAVVLFVTEAVPLDTTAIGIVVALVALGGFTGVTAREALSGFSGQATITILAMYVLSEGVERTGVVQRLGRGLAAVAGGDERRLLGAVVGVTSGLAGVVNNTPVVAIFVPMVTDLSERIHVSPSRLLIPLSYASMLGGTLTLLGTAGNVVASDLIGRIARESPERYPELPAQGYGMFDFTVLGVLVVAVGGVYLLTVGRRLLPDRVPVVDLTGRYGMEDHLWRVYVRQASPVVGSSVAEALENDDGAFDLDIDVVQIVRGRETYVAPGTDRPIEAGDLLTVRASGDVVREFVDRTGLRLMPQAPVTEDELANPEGRGTLVEAVVPQESGLVGQTIAGARLRQRFADTVLAVRRGEDVIREGLADVELTPGTALLVHTRRANVETIRESGDLRITTEAKLAATESEPLGRDAPLAVGILLGVVVVAAANLLPIAIAALAGMVAMIVTGLLDPGEAYDAVSWEIIFLLAGVVPLGVAMQETGGAAFLAGAIVSVADVLPAVVVLALFYLLTGLLANVITPVASVALVLPVAVDAAATIGADAFAFALGVTFAGSTAFMTPVGYQTNLMVYSPGGYRFTDYLRVGAPLQLLLTVVTPPAIDLIWTV